MLQNLWRQNYLIVGGQKMAQFREVEIWFNAQTPQGFKISKDWKSITEAIEGLKELKEKSVEV
jgi:hypothetical protein